MINEEWRPVVGYEGFYEVSNLGNVKSVSRNACRGKAKTAGGFMWRFKAQE